MVTSVSFWVMLLAIATTLLGVTAFSLASIGVALLATALIVALRFVARAEGRVKIAKMMEVGDE